MVTETCYKCGCNVVATIEGDEDCKYYRFECKPCAVKWMRNYYGKVG